MTRKGSVAAFLGVLLLAATGTVVLAQEVAAETTATGGAPFSTGKLFTFLFVTLGPFKVLGPFAKMTAGRTAAFKRRLALRGFVIALIAALASATLGASTLERWGISVAALTLTAGIILFLVALQPVLRQYEARDGGPDASPDAAPPSVSSLAFSPLAFPTIVTPYGIAVLIIAVALSPRGIAGILSLVGVVLLLDLLAMLVADRVLKTPFLAATFAIAGAVLGVLQMALGVQAAANAVRVLAAGGAA